MLTFFYTLLAQNEDIPLGGGFESPSTIYDLEGLDPGGEVALTTLETFISNIVGFLTILTSLFFIVYTFTAAFQWVTAGGDSGKIQKCKDRIQWGTLGLILVVAAYGIVGLLSSVIGVRILNPAEMIREIIPGS